MNCSEKFQFNFYFGAFFFGFGCMDVYHLLHNYILFTWLIILCVTRCVMLMLNKNIADKMLFFFGEKESFLQLLEKNVFIIQF